MTASARVNCFGVLSKLLPRVESYIEQQTLILEYLKKAQAQAHVSLSDDFLDFNHEDIYHYLWSLSDRLEITTSMYEGLIDNFLEIRALFLPQFK